MIDLEGTFGVLNALLDSSVSPFGEEGDAIMLTFWRHWEAEREALAKAIDAARETIFSPLHAQAYPKGAK
jgi:hypothetical protein